MTNTNKAPRLVRAIRIDPFAQTVEEVQHNAADYTAIYDQLSVPDHKVSCFTIVGIDERENGDSIFVDDEGLLKGNTHFFQWQGYAQPLAGCGLILGCDNAGDSVACSISLEEARAKVSFLGLGSGDAVLAANPTRIYELNDDLTPGKRIY